MADFVLEIGTEEVPAGVVVPALQQLEARFRELLERERIGFSEIRTLGTPRRLVVLATGVAERQADAIVEQRGPARQAAFDAGGTPTRAAEGFARRFGLTPADLVTRAVGSAEYVFALQKVVGRSTSGVLGESLPGLLGTLTFPKFMRWGEGAHRFCRPIRWLLALLGDEVVPLEAAGVRAGRECWGHRFLPIQDGEGHRVQVASAGEYLAAVERARVVLDPAVRQRRIVEQGDALAAAEGLRIAWDPDLLHEVTYVVEFPTAFVGRFSEEYLALPRAVLVSAMKKHQRYFTVENQDGTLAPRFLAVRNGDEYGLDRVRLGNERVLTFRFNDAAHHAREDEKRTLEQFREELKRIVFLEKLGSVWDRSNRLERWMAGCDAWAGDAAGQERGRRAARLCKADLASHMVAELPELQGVMGALYALRDGEDPAVAEAIENHYRPRAAGDPIPETHGARLLALADRLDLLVAAFSLGFLPTGSSDPFGLRRAAAGVVALLQELPTELELPALLALSYRTFAEEEYFRQAQPREAAEVEAELLRFLRPRLEAVLEEAAVRRDLADAVLSVGFASIPGTLGRAAFLQGRLANPSWKPVVEAGTRLRNILKPTDANPAPGDLGRLEHPTERALLTDWEGRAPRIRAAVAAGRWDAAWPEWAALAPVLEGFFNDVLVNAPEPELRAARLALLRSMDETFRTLAEFSRIADLAQ